MVCLALASVSRKATILEKLARKSNNEFGMDRTDSLLQCLDLELLLLPGCLSTTVVLLSVEEATSPSNTSVSN